MKARDQIFLAGSIASNGRIFNTNKMKKLINWFAGFFEDQGNSASSKRLVLYIFTFIFYMEVRGNLDGKAVDPQILYATIGVILFCIGAVTAEFFGDKTKISSTETTTKTDTTTTP